MTELSKMLYTTFFKSGQTWLKNLPSLVLFPTNSVE